MKNAAPPTQAKQKRLIHIYVMHFKIIIHVLLLLFLLLFSSLQQKVKWIPIIPDWEQKQYNNRI
jgi:hypothetical protein